MQAVGRVVRHLGEADAAGAGPAVRHLDGADEKELALVAAPAAAGEGIMLAAAGDFAHVDFDQAGERGAARRHHAAAQLGAQQPSALVGAEGELTLQLQSRDPVGMGGHQIGRPEPGGQRQLGVMHDGAGGDRGLLAAAGTLPKPAFAKAGVHGLVCSCHALVLPQPGHTKPSGQRAAKRYLTQAASSQKRCWNSIKEPGKSLIGTTGGHRIRYLF